MAPIILTHQRCTNVPGPRLSTNSPQNSGCQDVDWRVFLVPAALLNRTLKYGDANVESEPSEAIDDDVDE